jgi:hypothetical protein
MLNCANRCRLLQRYQNVKAELEAQQIMERIRMEKVVQSGMFLSTSAAAKSTVQPTKRSAGGRRGFSDDTAEEI